MCGSGALPMTLVSRRLVEAFNALGDPGLVCGLRADDQEPPGSARLPRRRIHGESDPGLARPRDAEVRTMPHGEQAGDVPALEAGQICTPASTELVGKESGIYLASGLSAMVQAVRCLIRVIEDIVDKGEEFVIPFDGFGVRPVRQHVKARQEVVKGHFQRQRTALAAHGKPCGHMRQVRTERLGCAEHGLGPGDVETQPQRQVTHLTHLCHTCSRRTAASSQATPSPCSSMRAASRASFSRLALRDRRASSRVSSSRLREARASVISVTH